MINQHLITGTYDEISSYFANKVKANGTQTDCDSMFVEIPTMPVKTQLSGIYLSDEPRTGFVFYFVRNIINNPDGTFDVNVNLGMEMVWIRDSGGSAYNNEIYPRAIFNEIIQHKSNTDVIDILKDYATRK